MSVPRTQRRTQYATRDTEDVPSKPKQIGELSMVTHPPIDWIASLEVLLSRLEEFIKFVNGHLCLPLKAQCNFVLRGMRRDWIS